MEIKFSLIFKLVFWEWKQNIYLSFLLVMFSFYILEFYLRTWMTLCWDSEDICILTALRSVLIWRIIQTNWLSEFALSLSLCRCTVYSTSSSCTVVVSLCCTVECTLSTLTLLQHLQVFTLYTLLPRMMLII